MQNTKTANWLVAYFSETMLNNGNPSTIYGASITTDRRWTTNNHRIEYLSFRRTSTRSPMVLTSASVSIPARPTS